MPDRTVTNALLAVIVAILGVGALRIGFPVLMPIAVAVFVIAGCWPLRQWFHARLPSALAYIFTIVALLILVGGFLAVVGYALERVVRTFIDQREAFRAVYDAYSQFARDAGLPTPLSGAGAGASFERIVALSQTFLAQVYAAVSYFGVISVIVILGFPEVPAVARRFRHQFDLDRTDTPSPAVRTIREIAHSFRSYVAMTALTSLITGVASALWAYTVGLDLALVWGLLNFLLNFIPVVGNVVGVVPPVLYAIVQFGGWTMPVVVLVGFLALQLVISNFVYPLLQSRGLAMPAVTIIVALLFWGWAWGFIGALFAVPLTAAVLIVMRKFDATKPLAAVLGSSDPKDEVD